VGTTAYQQKPGCSEQNVGRGHYPKRRLLLLVTTQGSHGVAEDECRKCEHGNDAEVEHKRHGAYQRPPHSEFEQVFIQVRDVNDAMKHRGSQYRDTGDEKNGPTNSLTHQD
jgi:hypothetical protein